MAGCHVKAAEIYARGNYVSECLSSCTRGKLFDIGLQYIQCWKQAAPRHHVMAKVSSKIEQHFLERCARHYNYIKDKKSMMRFVRAMNSMDLRREFLKSLKCFDELLILEEESGNFLEAAKIAKVRGDILHESDLLGKAGRLHEAAMLILWYVFANSMWVSRSKGWPLKHFPQKEEILNKAKSFAKNESDLFYEFVCTEASILSNEETNLFMLNQYLNTSRGNKSLTGEILSTDLDLESLERENGEYLSYLNCLENKDLNDSINYCDFCLNYFGVWRRLNNMNTSYVILNSDADWVKEIQPLHRNEELASIDARHFVSAARSHWQSDLLSVGLKVLETLEALHKLSIKNSVYVFRQSITLVYMFEVTMFLLGSKYLDCKYRDAQTLHNFRNLSTLYFHNVFPLDWQKSLSKDMTSLRGSEVSRNLLEEVILENISFKGKLTYGQIGRVVMIWLGSGKPTEEIYKKISRRFDANSLWRQFIDDLSGNTESELLQKSVSGILIEAPKEVSSVYKFHKALEDAYNANWRESDYISPSCFVYLLERLLILASSFCGFLFTTKSSFIEWIICEQPRAKQSADVANYIRSTSGIFDFVASRIRQILFDGQVTFEWIKKSNMNFNSCYPLLLLRLVVMLCLLCLNCENYYDLVFELLGRSDITSRLPKEFYDVFRRTRRHINVIIIAEALMKIGNPLVLVSLGENCSESICPHAIYVDLTVTQSREEILEILFPKDYKDSQEQTVAVELDTASSCGKKLTLNNENQAKTSKDPFSNSAFLTDQNMESLHTNEENQKLISPLFGEISDALNAIDNEGRGNVQKFVSGVSKIKVGVEKVINFISEDGTLIPSPREDCQVRGTSTDNLSLLQKNGMLDELKEISSALNVGDSELNKNIPNILSLLTSFRWRKPQLETLLTQLCMPNDTNGGREASETVGLLSENENNHTKVKESSTSDKVETLDSDVVSGTPENENWHEC